MNPTLFSPAFLLSPRRLATLAGLALGGLATSGQAQLIYLKNGQTAPAVNLRVDNGTLHTTVQIGQTLGDQGYPVSQVDRIELPPPKQLNDAEQLMLTGRGPEALAMIEPVIAAYNTFRDIKGSFWAQAALIKSAALQSMGKRDEAAVILTALSKYTLDPSLALTSTARLAGILAQTGVKDKVEQAGTLADAILGNSKIDDPAVLGETWLAKGRSLFAQEKYEDALLAFLHLPVFYYDNPGATAQAILASGKCYSELDDDKKAARAFLDVQEHYPVSPEAAEAKKEIAKGGAAMAKLVKTLDEEKAEAEKKLRESVSNTAS